MTKQELEQLADYHFNDEEYSVMFGDSLPAWVAKDMYQAGARMMLALVYKQLDQCTTLDCESAAPLLNAFKELLP